MVRRKSNVCILQFDWLIAIHFFNSLVRNASFLIVKSGVREEVIGFNKSLCKNILLVSLRLCTSPLVCAPPLLTLFTSPTTPPTPRHVRGRQFPMLDIWQSPNKFTGKRKNQCSRLHLHEVAVPISTARFAPPSLADKLLRSE